MTWLSLLSAASFLIGQSRMALAAPTATSPIAYHIAFGDSYTASGFNVSSTWPNPSNPMGNPRLGLDTFSGGYNWLTYLTTRYNLSTTYTFDFAYGGATTDQRIVPQAHPTILSATDQVFGEFLPHLSHGPWAAHVTLFSLLIGINDINYGIIYHKDINTTLPLLLEQRQNLTDALYKAGARHFLFQNIPPIDRTPQVIAAGAAKVEQNVQWVTAYNEALVTFNKNFKDKYSDVVVYEYDLWSFFTKVLNKPTAYGFTNATTIGTGNFPHVWANTYHPGYAFDNLWAQDLAKTFRF